MRLLALLLCAGPVALAQDERFGKLLVAELPPARLPSFLDRFPAGACVPKLIYEGRLIVSRRELESAARQSNARVRYLGAARRAPDWEDFPALIQPLEISPGLPGLALFGDRAERITVAKLQAREYFTFSPAKLDNSMPLGFQPPVKAAQAIGVVLLSGSVMAAIAPPQVAVKTSRRRRSGARISVTTADLNADGQPEIVHIVRDTRDPSCNPSEDECGHPACYVGILSRGAWRLTGRVEHGHDGPLGF